MELQKLNQDFTVCLIKDIQQIDFTQEFLFLSKTDEELSLVCESSSVPPHTLAAEAGWKALRITGSLDFSLVGVIAKISRLLAEAGISLFVVSTYRTDYILLKKDVYEQSITILQNKGYKIHTT